MYYKFSTGSNIFSLWARFLGCCYTGEDCFWVGATLQQRIGDGHQASRVPPYDTDLDAQLQACLLYLNVSSSIFICYTWSWPPADLELWKTFYSRLALICLNGTNSELFYPIKIYFLLVGLTTISSSEFYHLHVTSNPYTIWLIFYSEQSASVQYLHSLYMALTTGQALRWPDAVLGCVVLSCW